jgi:TatD DNase family protein
MPLNIIDTHAHLDMPQFNSDRELIIKRAADAGVSVIITNGTDLDSSRQAIRLAEQFPGVYATVGFHPQDARKMKPGDIDILARLAKHPRVVAIGEIGFDYYRENTHRTSETGLGQNSNYGKLEHRWLSIPPCRAVMTGYWINGTFVQSTGCVSVQFLFNSDISPKTIFRTRFLYRPGSYIGSPSSKMSDVIKSIPIDKLLIETDCPFLPPQSHRGKRNEPAYLPETLDALAGIRGEPAEYLAKQTTENALRLFCRIN